MGKPGEGVPRVLHVDDATDDTEMYKEFLEARGYSVDVASDGEEAVSFALNRSYKLVVLDIGLPKLDGLQVLMLLRSYTSTASLPVITLSSHTGEEARAAAVDAGADLALEKPLPPDELAICKIMLWIGRRHRSPRRS